MKTISRADLVRDGAVQPYIHEHHSAQFVPPAGFRLMQEVCERCDLEVEDVISRSREPWLDEVRKECAVRMYKQGMSVRAIALVLRRTRWTIRIYLGQVEKRPGNFEPRFLRKLEPGIADVVRRTAAWHGVSINELVAAWVRERIEAGAEGDGEKQQGYTAAPAAMGGQAGAETRDVARRTVPDAA